MTRAMVEAALAGVALTLACADLAGLAAAHGNGGRLRMFATAAGRLVPAQASPDRLPLAAAQAGLQHWADDVYAVKCGAALVSALLAVPVLGVAGIGPGTLVLLTVAGVAFIVPDLVLRRRIAHRRAQIALELPTVLDLLAVAIDAGMPIAAALEQTAARDGGILVAELRLTQRAIAAGSRRGDALHGLRDRCPHEGVAALVAAIDRSDRHGGRLGPALRDIAADARRHRARAAYERAARAAPQIQLVIALGLVPATMLVVAAALIASL